MTAPDTARDILVPPGSVFDVGLVLPIGHLIGGTDDQRTGEIAYRVRVGPDVVTLTTTQYVLWALTHSQSGRGPDERWGRNHVLTAAAVLNLEDDPTEVLDELIDDGLVAEIEPDSEDVNDFGGRYRLSPLMLGLGNSAEEPGQFQIGLPDLPLIKVSGLLYDLYAWGHLYPDLTSAVRASVESLRDHPELQPGGPLPLDPDELLDGVVQSLHILLAPNTAYLDVRRSG
jgi:hypothetical protein